MFFPLRHHFMIILAIFCILSLIMVHIREILLVCLIVNSMYQKIRDGFDMFLSCCSQITKFNKGLLKSVFFLAYKLLNKIFRCHFHYLKSFQHHSTKHCRLLQFGRRCCRLRFRRRRRHCLVRSFLHRECIPRCF